MTFANKFKAINSTKKTTYIWCIMCNAKFVAKTVLFVLIFFFYPFLQLRTKDSGPSLNTSI